MKLTTSASLELVANFGQTEEQTQGWKTVSLSHDLPATDAVKEDRGAYLTKRQMIILEMMGRKMTNMQIAKELGYSESTIRHETMRIYALLQASGRREAVVLARKLSLIK